MHSTLNRRAFLKGSAATVLLTAAGATAAEPFQRPGPARLAVSLAAYSFRDYFKDSNHERKTAAADKRIAMFQFVDYCAAQGCAGAELTSYYFPTDATTDYMLKLRRHCFLRGVEVSGGAARRARPPTSHVSSKSSKLQTTAATWPWSTNPRKIRGPPSPGC